MVFDYSLADKFDAEICNHSTSKEKKVSFFPSKGCYHVEKFKERCFKYFVRLLRFLLRFSNPMSMIFTQLLRDSDLSKSQQNSYSEKSTVSFSRLISLVRIAMPRFFRVLSVTSSHLKDGCY